MFSSTGNLRPRGITGNSYQVLILVLVYLSMKALD